MLNEFGESDLHSLLLQEPLPEEVIEEPVEKTTGVATASATATAVGKGTVGMGIAMAT